MPKAIYTTKPDSVLTKIERNFAFGTFISLNGQTDFRTYVFDSAITFRCHHMSAHTDHKFYTLMMDTKRTILADLFDPMGHNTKNSQFCIKEITNDKTYVGRLHNTPYDAGAVIAKLSGGWSVAQIPCKMVT